MEPLKEWAKDDPISANHLNEVIRRVNKAGDLYPGNGINITQGMGGTLIEANTTHIIRDMWVGEIVEEGPPCEDDEEGDGLDDFPDHRYWVKKKTNEQQSGEDQQTLNTYKDDPQSEGATPSIWKVENLYERNGKSHFLTKGELVNVLAIDSYLAADDHARTRYVMYALPKGLLGKVVAAGPSGESDYTDNRYWVQVIRISNTDGTPTTVLTTEKLPKYQGTPDGAPDPKAPVCSGDSLSSGSALLERIITVTNIGEIGHGLAVDTKIAINCALDKSDPPKLRFYTVTAPSSGFRVTCVDDYAHVNGYVSVTKAGDTGGTPFNVTIIHHTSTGDSFNVVPVTGGTYPYVQIGYPTQRTQYMLLQIMDSVGGAQSIDWDYIKGR